MTSEIKFTSFGIPYLVEFANVKFRSALKRRSAYTRPKRSHSHSSSSTSSSSFSLIETSESLITSSSETLACPDEGEGEGLFIQFASYQQEPRQPLSEARLSRLKHKIANAVMAAGMTTPAAMDRTDPMERAMQRLSRQFERRPHRETGSPSSFYRGTYGQVMAALESAGLTITHCKESGMEDGIAQRLGALFVARHTEWGTIELIKLTLWA